jgi:uncharacterized protein YdeI (BOF family)
MKKYFILHTAIFLLSSIAYADTVREIKEVAIAWDTVTVTGTITQEFETDRFIFKDDTGEIQIKIKPYIWQQIHLSNADFKKVYKFTAKVNKAVASGIQLDATLVNIVK